MGEIESKNPFGKGAEQPQTPIRDVQIHVDGRSHIMPRSWRGKMIAGLAGLAVAYGVVEVASKIDGLGINLPLPSISGQEQGGADFSSVLKSIKPPQELPILEGQVEGSATLNTDYELKVHTPIVGFVGDALGFAYNKTIGVTTHRTVCSDRSATEEVIMPDSAYTWAPYKVPGKKGGEGVLVTVNNPSLLRTELVNPETTTAKDGQPEICDHDGIGARVVDLTRSKDHDAKDLTVLSQEVDNVTEAECGEQMRPYLAAGIVDGVGAFLARKSSSTGTPPVKVKFVGGKNAAYEDNLTPGVPTTVPGIEADLKNKLGNNTAIKFSANNLSCTADPEAVQMANKLAAESTVATTLDGVAPLY